MPLDLLIVGLGNPGAAYDNTPHNIGFEVVDALASKLNAPKWAAKTKFHALTTELPAMKVSVPDARDAVDKATSALTLMKPMTYMNVSGQAVMEWVRARAASPGQIVVVCDDVNLESGRIRIRLDGSSGGQKGLQNIIEMTGTQSVARLRVGIMPGAGRVPGGDLSSYVLKRWNPEGRDLANYAVACAVDALLDAIGSGGFQRAMSLHNAKKPVA